MPRIAVALTEAFADWECALVTAVARSYLGAEVVTATPDGSPVTSMGGLRVLPDTSFADLEAEDFDALLVPGGLAWERGSAPDLGALVRSFRARGRVVGGICAAASAVAGTGVVDGLAHTGNALASHEAYPGYGGRAHYRDGPVAVSDGGVITAPGTAPVTFAVEVLTALGLWNDEAAAEIAGFAGEHRPPPG